MPYPNSIDAPDTAMQGGSFLATNDHALDHRTLGSAAIAIENVLGTTAGTSVVKNFAAGDFAARINSGGTLQQSLTGTVNLSGQATNIGTMDGGAYGSATYLGGTMNNTTLGTPTIVVGSDAQGDLYYHSSAGSLTQLPAGTAHQVLTTGGTGANPSFLTFGKSITIQITSDVIGTNTAYATITGLVGTITPDVTSNALVMLNGGWYNAGSGNDNYLIFSLNGTTQANTELRNTAPGANYRMNAANTAWLTNLPASAGTIAVQAKVAGGTFGLGGQPQASLWIILFPA